MTTRRRFFGLLGAAAVIAPLAVMAQSDPAVAETIPAAGATLGGTVPSVSEMNSLQTQNQRLISLLIEANAKIDEANTVIGEKTWILSTETIAQSTNQHAYNKGRYDGQREFEARDTVYLKPNQKVFFRRGDNLHLVRSDTIIEKDPIWS